MYETEALGLGFGVAFFAIYFIVLFGVALTMYLLQSFGKIQQNSFNALHYYNGGCFSFCDFCLCSGIFRGGIHTRS